MDYRTLVKIKEMAFVINVRLQKYDDIVMEKLLIINMRNNALLNLSIEYLIKLSI